MKFKLISKNIITFEIRPDPKTIANNNYKLGEPDIRKYAKWKYTGEMTNFMPVWTQVHKNWIIRFLEIEERRCLGNWNTKDELLSQLIDLINDYNYSNKFQNIKSFWITRAQ
jgi:hypothetical protein